MERAIDDLLRRMTLEEKVGQVIQPSITTITPEDVRTYKFGSVLNGGGGWPGDIRQATAADWLALADAFHEASMDTSGGRQAIPVIWGADAVHGHSNVIGATLFPHNVGLGAMRNPELIRRIGEVTAAEMSVTGIDWNFSPTVAVALDDRWGRSYESYSEDPELVRAYAEMMVEGLQGEPNTADFFSRGRVIATAKHFVGDGGTVGGKDQGDNVATEAELRDIHAQGYYGAMESGVQVVMASYNSWHGVK
ncbi:MAG: glycoside hydrolase family 3 protein, partial [Acidobacteria bacterium]|nr:glycoside hydrolase family 3 protein [Acidobacteriota bacterium]